MFASKLSAYESEAARRWTSTWCKGYEQALLFVTSKIDSVLADAELAGVKPEVTLVAERNECLRKQAVVTAYINKHYTR
jgi:hypothetical protein